MSQVNWSALKAGDKWTFHTVTHISCKVQKQSLHTETAEDFQQNIKKKKKRPRNGLTLAIKASERGARSLKAV